MIDHSLTDRLQMMLIQAVPFVMAIVFHEFAHGFVANKFGDTTAKNMGRLTLNPLPHLDPIGTILFPAINMILGINLLFGWARPVPINPTQFTKYRAGLFWVSLAGPGMNFLLAIISSLMFCLINHYIPANFYLYEPLIAMAYISISLNYALAIFNLIPLPPLDGSKMVESFLSYETARKYEAISQYSFFILLGLLWIGAFQMLTYPINFLTQVTLYLASAFFGLIGIN
ncbi:MAG: site-2 protease family protein [Bdellovibrio sp.]|nr:site-2 protease family protein [Bdellovibrio sp.]